jgi:hypothetical protein
MTFIKSTLAKLLNAASRGCSISGVAGGVDGGRSAGRHERAGRTVGDSGITWRFLAEHSAQVVQREAGHKHSSTTLGYAKEVQDKRGRHGAPFPTLPATLVESSRKSSDGEGGASQVAETKRTIGSGRRDLNPEEQAPSNVARSLIFSSKGANPVSFSLRGAFARSHPE